MSSMYLVCLGKDGVHDGDDVGGGGEVVEAQHALELLQAHHRRRARHEPHDRRVRQEVHDEPQPIHHQIISRQLQSHFSPTKSSYHALKVPVLVKSEDSLDHLSFDHSSYSVVVESVVVWYQ